MKPIAVLISTLATLMIVAAPVCAGPSPAAEKPDVRPISAKPTAPGTREKPGAPTSAAKPAAAAATPATPVVIVNVPPAQPAPPPPSNNWGTGLIGLCLLAGAGFFGLRYARGRGVTVATSLKQLGVEMPQDGGSAAAPIAHLRPPATTVQLPPLRSLSDLPEPVPDATIQGELMPTPVNPVRPSPVNAGNAAPSGPSLLGLAGPIAGERFALASPTGEPLTIGREMDNVLQLVGDTTVSRYHARVMPSAAAGIYTVVDQGSSNGTWVNGERLPQGEPYALRPGDEIQVGSTRLRFEAGVR